MRTIFVKRILVTDNAVKVRERKACFANPR
jgi:hypothetical protein